jgi:hypothetical protein
MVSARNYANIALAASAMGRAMTRHTLAVACIIMLASVSAPASGASDLPPRHGFLPAQGGEDGRHPEGGEGGVAAHDRVPPPPSALPGCCAHPSSARR